MISLGGLVSQRAFGKFEMGKVISNPFANAFIKEGEGEDHEVSMANNSLDTIIKMATELKAKMGENEKDIPAWIQDHITNAENFISQASSNYHEYGQNEARIAEDKGPCWKGYKQVGMKDKGGRQVPNCVPNESVVTESSFKTSQLPTWLLLDDAIEFMEWYKDGMELKKGRIAPFNKADELSLFRLIKAWMQADDEYSKGVAHGGGVTGKRPNREQYKEKIEKFLLQKAKVANESVVNEEPAKTTGEKIQNLNNRIKALKDKMAATKSSEQKNLIQQRLKNALQTLSNYKKQNVSKESIVKEESPCWKGYKQVGMKDKGGRQVPNCVPNESIVKEGRSIKKIQTDYAKAVEAIQNELALYKQHKDTPNAKKHVENLKKLNDVKKKLEAELDNSVTSLYKDAELKAED